MMENSNVISWEDAALDLNENLGVEITKIQRLSTKNIPFSKYFEVIDWEGLSDEQVFEYILGFDDSTVSGKIYAITDVSYLNDNGVFVFDCSNSMTFIKQYFQRFGESFFNGDVIFIFPLTKSVILFQHDGFFIRYSMPVSEL